MPPVRFGLEVTFIMGVLFGAYSALNGFQYTVQDYQFLIASAPLIAGIVAGVQYSSVVDNSQKGENGE